MRTTKDETETPTQTTGQTPAEGGRTRQAVQGLEGFEAQEAALAPGAHDTLLDDYATRLNGAKTPTERQAVLMEAESKGLMSSDVEERAKELEPPEEEKKEEEEEEAAEGEGDGAAEVEADDPAKLKEALEEKLATAKTTQERQAVLDQAKREGITLDGSVSSEEGVVAGVTLAGATDAAEVKPGEKAARSAEGAVGVGNGKLSAGGDVVSESSMFEGQKTSNRVGADAMIDAEGKSSFSVGGRSTSTYDSTAPLEGAAENKPAGAAGGAEKKEAEPGKETPDAKAAPASSVKSSETTYGRVGWDSERGMSAVAGQATKEERKDGAVTVTNSNSAQIDLSATSIGIRGSDSTSVSEEIELTEAEKAEAAKKKEEKDRKAAEAHAAAVKEAEEKGEEPPEKPEAEEAKAPANVRTSGATGELGLNEKGLVVKVGAEESVKNAERIDTPATESRTKAGVGYTSEKGFSAEASKEESWSVEEGMSVSNSKSLTYEDGNAKGALSRTETYAKEGGGTSSESQEFTAGIGKDGVTAGYNAGAVEKAADGSSSEVNYGVNANLTEGKVGGNIGAAKKDAEGNVERGISASGELDFAADGHLEGASGSVAVTKGPVNVVASGKYTYKLEEPKQVGDEWVVSYTTSVGGELGGGGKGGTVGVNASAGGSSTTQGEQHFKTKGEADAFHARGPATTAVPATSAAADKMAVGDRVSSTTEAHGKVGGSAMIEGLQIGASLRIGGGHTVTVVKADPNTVHVEVTDVDTLGGEATLGTFGVSLKAGASRTLSQGVVMAFDLSKPEGRAAFESFRATGVLPRDGATMVAKTEGKATSTTSGGSLGIAEFSDTATVEQSTTTTAAGDKIERAAGTESAGIDAGFLGKHKVDTSLDTRETNDTARKYSTKTTVDSSSAQSANSELAQATGTHTNANVGGAAPKGTWSVTSHFSEAQIQTLISKINSDRFNYHMLIYESGDGAALVAAVKGSGGDMDKVRLALSEFIAETGSRGLELMRQTIGGQFEFDLQLSDDKYFKGAAGREAVERAIADYRARLSAPGDKSTVLSGIAQTLMEQQEKLSVVSDPAKYPELPSELRAQEIARTRGYVTTLEGLRDQAMAALANPTAAGAEAKAGTPGKAPTQTSGKTSSATTAKAPTPAGPQTAAQAIAREWQTIAEGEARYKTVKDEAARLRHLALHSRWVHVGGAYAFHYSAYEQFGTEGWFSNGEFINEYKGADGYYQSGKASWTRAEELDRTFARAKSETMIAASQHPDAWAGKIEAMFKPMLSTAADAYSNTGTYFKYAESKYQEVKRLILAKDPGNVNAYFLGYDHDLPEGANIP